MLKHERAALRRTVAAIYADAEIVYALVKGIVAAQPYSVPATHHAHIADIVGELLRVAPALSGNVALLTQLGEHDAARAAVSEALATLKEVDGRIFEPAPSVRLTARLMVGEGAATDTWCSAIGSAEYMTSDARRRVALKVKRDLDARGEPVPDESDAASLLDRDAARAEESRTGGGIAASRVS